MDSYHRDSDAAGTPDSEPVSESRVEISLGRDDECRHSILPDERFEELSLVSMCIQETQAGECVGVRRRDENSETITDISTRQERGTLTFGQQL